MTKRTYDTNGWPEIKDNPISKIGVFPYLGSSIGAPDPTKIYMVRRSKEELSSKEAIESFKLVPWVDDHTMLGDKQDGFTPAEEKGIQGVTGEDVYFKGDTLYANLKLFSESQADLVETGKKELSLGYRCKYVEKSGVYMGKKFDYDQINPRGNHIASVDDGRMGSQVAVLDSSDIISNDTHCFFTIDSQDIIMTPQEKAALAAKQKSSVLSAGQTAADAAISGMESGGANVSDETKQVIASLPSIIGATMQAMDEMKDKEKMSEDEEEEKKEGMDEMYDKDGNKAKDGMYNKDGKKMSKDKDEMKEKGKGMDAALITSLQTRLDASEKATQTAMDTIDELKTNSLPNLLGEVSRRDAMCRAASVHIGAFDHSLMTEQKAAVYINGKLGLDAAEGHELVAVNAALKMLSKAPAPSQTFVAQDHKDTTGGSTAIDSFIHGDK